MKLGRFRHSRSIVAGLQAKSSQGFTLIELVIVLVITVIMTAIAVPMLNNVMNNYRLRAAVSSVTGAIQSSRYQAISSGFAYQIVLKKTAGTFQVQSDPNHVGTFSNVGNAIPLASSSIPVVLGADTTLQFRPSGLVAATVGNSTLTLAYGGKTETITVSSYGNIKVTP
ncbi:MAG TPA: GspH/FimT family pseudopilin [Candidatus Angelobacter sp.]|nr:GspH/FimT family pseudopilin [Candidatus Angelobacter sp.]